MMKDYKFFRRIKGFSLMFLLGIVFVANPFTAETQTYCTPAPFPSGCAGGDRIDDFLMPDGGIVNEDVGCLNLTAPTYSDFFDVASAYTNGQSGQLVPGETYDFTANHSFGSQRVRIWIDFNQDGDFDDPGELVYDSPSGANPTIGTITIPVDAMQGETRMRVMTRWSVIPAGPCDGGGGWGETHDYKVTILPGACDFPVISIEVIEDCNEEEFEVVLDWEDLGSEDEFEVEDDQGSPGQTITSPGVLNFGPYAFGTAVEFNYEAVGNSDCSGTLSALFIACPPENDDCDDPVDLMPDPDFVCSGTFTYSATTSGATNSGTTGGACASGGLAGGDVWFTFTATSDRHRLNYSNIEGVNGTSTMVTAFFTSDTCDALVEFGCLVSNGPINLTGLTIGNTYAMRVWTQSSDPFQYNNFDICISTFPPPPSNDLCVDAMELIPSTDCSSTAVAGTTLSATNSGETDPTCNVAGLAGGDVWYKFEATSNVHIVEYSNVVNNGGTTMVSALYSGECGDLVQIRCLASNLRMVVGDLEIGTTYYLRVWTSNSAATGYNDFEVCIREVLPSSVHDVCDDAFEIIPSTDLSCSGVVTASTNGTNSMAVDPTCSATGLAGGDVWFKFTATSENHRISYSNVFNNGTASTLVTEVYSGDCGSLVSFDCGSSNVNRNLFDLEVGTTYYVRVWTLSAVETQLNVFDICIGSYPPPPPNDDCTDAIEVAIPSVTEGYNILAMDSDIGFTCGTGSGNGATAFAAVWYQVVGDGNELIVSTCHPDTDHSNRISIYTGDCDDLVCVTGAYSTTAIDGCVSGRTQVSFQSEVDEVYYIVVSAPFSTTPQGNHVLTILPIVCEITCPDDIVVSPDPGECTAELTVNQIPELGQFCLQPDIVPVPTGFFEDFDDEVLPSGWENIDSVGSGQIWTFNNPGNRVINGMNDGFAILDSDNYGGGNTQDAYLVTPSIDVSGQDVVIVGFFEHFRPIGSSFGALEVSTDAGDSWAEVFRHTSAVGSTTTPWTAAQNFYDLTNFVDGADELIMRFRYSGTFGWWWAIDEVAIFTADLSDVLVNDFNNEVFVSGIFDAGTTTEVTFTYSDTLGGEYSCSFNIIVSEDEEAPFITCPANVTVEVDFGVTEADVDGLIATAEDNCAVEAIVNDYNDGGDDASDTYPEGTTVVTFTATDESGNTAECTTSVTVTSDDVPPINIVCQDVTAELDGDGNATVDAEDLDGGSTGGAGDLTFTVGGETSVSFGCTDVGANTVTLTATDEVGFSESCDAVVTVEDNIAPVVSCEAEVVQMVANPGDTEAFVNVPLAAASDNCGDPALENSYNDGGADASDVYPVGTTVVTYTAVDDSGNQAECATNVIVEADLSIVALCQDASVSLDEDGNASVDASDLDDGSFGGDGALSFSVGGADAVGFDCEDVGSNSVTLTVSDAAGNSETCESTVTVSDNMAPQLSCASVVNKIVDNVGDLDVFVDILLAVASDNCGVESIMNSYNDGGADASDVYPVGTTQVVYTATDVNGNSATCQTTVIVVADDSIIPVCADVSADLDADGNATVAAEDLDGGSFGGEGDLSFSVNGESSISFDCNDVGANTVVLTVSDEEGNSETCESVVTISDNIAPEVSCASDVEQMVANPGDTEVFVNLPLASATDNCGVASIENSVNDGGADASDVFSVGTHLITYTATDVNGNSAQCETVLTVLADESLVAICTNGAATVDASGTATLSAAMLDGGSFGGEGALTFTVGGNATVEFGCADLGTNTVTLEVTDAAGTTETCEATVVVDLDGVTEVSCNDDVAVELDADGIGSVDIDDLIESAEATCGVMSMSASQLEFGCSDIGSNSVVVTITNIEGDEATCTATVTVVDNNDPVAECLDLTFPIPDADMTFFVNPLSLDGGSSATCGGLDFSIDGGNPGFSCDDEGVYTVTLVVTSDAGNTATCEANVTVLCVEGLIQISGNVEREFGQAVGGVEMTWLGNPGGISLSQGTGLYQIFVEENSNAVVTPQKDGNPSQFVTTADLIALQRHILGIELFESPYQIIAGDPSGDDVLSTLDLVILQSLIIGVIEDFPAPVWRFVPESYVFQDPSNPFGEDFPEVKGYQGVVNPQMNENWVAIKTGDVSWNYGSRLDGGTLNFNVFAEKAESGNQYLVFKTSESTEIFGYQMALDFDNSLTIAEFIPGSSMIGMNDLNFNMVDGIARTNYYNGEGIQLESGTEVFRLRVHGSETANALSLVAIYNQDEMRAEGYPVNGEMMQIALGTVAETSESWTISNVSPVPASDYLSLELNVAIDTDFELEVYNSNGQLIQKTSYSAFGGINVIPFDLSDYAAGAYFIRIVSSDKADTLPFIKVD